MTDQEKIKVLAELDGWQEPMSYPGSLPRYLISYDAIIPLIQKQPKEIRLKMWEPSNKLHIMSQPEQLADALIKAVGKWKD